MGQEIESRPPSGHQCLHEGERVLERDEANIAVYAIKSYKQKLRLRLPEMDIPT